MAALTNATRTTEVTEVVPAETIKGLLQANYRPRVADAIAYLIPVEKGQSRTINIPLAPVNTIASGTTLTEGEDADFDGSGNEFTTWETTEDTITLATYGIRRALTDQAKFHAVIDLDQSVMVSNLDALLDQRDRVLLAEAINASNTYNNSGNPLDLSAWNTAVQTYKAQNPVPGSMGFACVLHHDQYRDFADAVRSTQGSVFSGGLVDGTLSSLFNSRSGFHGVYEGFIVGESGGVIATDANNWSGFMCSAGQGGSLGLAVAMVDGVDVRMRVTGPDSDAANKMHTYIAAYADYGASIVDNDNFLEIHSQT